MHMNDKNRWKWTDVAALNFGFGHSVAHALLTLLCLTLLASAGHAQALRLAVSRTALSLPLDVAQEKAYFAQERLDLRITDHASGSQCLRQLQDRQADVAPAAVTLLR